VFSIQFDTDVQVLQPQLDDLLKISDNEHAAAMKASPVRKMLCAGCSPPVDRQSQEICTAVYRLCYLQGNSIAQTAAQRDPFTAPRKARSGKEDNYEEVLSLAYLFYEGQMAGDLPA
jgi:hypothetical protein